MAEFGDLTFPCPVCAETLTVKASISAYEEHETEDGSPAVTATLTVKNPQALDEHFATHKENRWLTT